MSHAARQAVPIALCRLQRSGVDVALALGFATGLRTMTPAALLAWRRGGRALGGVLGVLAIGEIVVDKLPGIPARTALLPSVARVGVAACLGAIAAGHGVRASGAALGALGALLGTRFGFAVRRAASARAPDALVAVTEDLTCLAIAAWATRQR